MEETRTEVETILQGIQMEPVLVGIVMGSESDREVMQKAAAELDERKIKYELNVLSAHRDPDKVAHYAKTAQSRGLKVLIGGAGKAAALPGVLAAYTNLPGDRRADQDQRPRRARLAAQHRADAARRARGLRRHQRRPQRRHPRGQDPRRLSGRRGAPAVRQASPAGNTPGMGRHAIRSSLAPPPPLGAGSPGISAGHFVFVSAQLPLGRARRARRRRPPPSRPAAPSRTCAHQLRSTGLSLDDVVSLEVHLVDPADAAAVDAAIAARFTPAVSRRHALRCTMVARRGAPAGRRHRATLLRVAGCRGTTSHPARGRSRASSTSRCSPSPSLLAYVAVRALFA